MKLINRVLFIIFICFLNLFAQDFTVQKGDSVKVINSRLNMNTTKKSINWHPEKDVDNFKKYLGIAVGFTLYFVVGNYATGKLNAN